MRQMPKIAVVAAERSELAAQLSGLAHAPVVQTFRDLFTDVDAIRRFRPDVLFLATDLDDEGAGGLRVVRGLLPEVALVLLCSSHREAHLRPIAERLNAIVLSRPFAPAQLTAALEAGLAGAPAMLAETLLNLVRGISDEINNPLLVAAGHLQLLESRLVAEADRDKLDLLRLVRDGIERIQTTMQRIRVLTHAGDGRGQRESVDLTELATRTAEQIGAAAGRDLAVTFPAEPHLVQGDPALLAAMLEALFRVALALSPRTVPARIDLAHDERCVRIRVVLAVSTLPPWRLPRTFEPYYLNRVLRGTPEGLSLFLVQIVAQDHGGRATARWEPDGGLRLELELAR